MLDLKEDIFIKKMTLLRDFNFKINYASNLFIQNPVNNPSYKIAIGHGNNSEMIKRLFKQRWYWQIVDDEMEANFYWT